LKQLERKYQKDMNRIVIACDINDLKSYTISDLTTKLLNPNIQVDHLNEISEEINKSTSSINKCIDEFMANIKVDLKFFDDKRFCQIVSYEMENDENKFDELHSEFPCKYCGKDGSYKCNNCNIRLDFNCLACGITGQTFDILATRNMIDLPSNIRSIYEKVCNICRSSIKLNCHECENRVEFTCKDNCSKKFTSLKSFYDFPDFE
jgi:hypothetical protein